MIKRISFDPATGLILATTNYDINQVGEPPAYENFIDASVETHIEGMMVDLDTGQLISAPAEE